MQYTLYIRKENDEAFKDEENKSELVNQLLAKHYENGTPVHLTTISVLPPEKKNSDTNAPGPNGYPCCSSQKRCKHWQWNADSGAWKNEITGKLREVVQ